MKLKLIRESFIKDVYELVPEIFQDLRGDFVKIFHEEFFGEKGLNTQWSEQYYSLSLKDVIRGMHFQSPPFDHEKLVTCLDGDIVDVVLDLREGSETYGLFDQFELSDRLNNSVYIPKGCAHGFFVKSEKALILYNVSTVFESRADSGVRWDSFGMVWPTSNPIMSEKDKNLPRLENYITPFKKQNRN